MMCCTAQGRLPDTLTEDEMAMFLSGQVPITEHHHERRSSPRHAYCCIRSVADWDEQAKGPEEFYQVNCRDLSTRGIGFFSPRKPTTNSLVIRLAGEAERPVVMAAKVVYCNDKSGDPTYPFVIGCMFTKRL